ncbi:HNH endonuclease, partial [Paenarthrobacter sp. NPDC018779]|uniref:HNH endonuclease n=1 Tax=Paenarthrobacter sp. NPDC018779 TaxID=3364375 RepID=UPI0037C7920C
RHYDHVLAWHSGGKTSLANGAGLCEACNHTKENPGWNTRPSDQGPRTLEIRTPTGHRYQSTAPPLPGTINPATAHADRSPVNGSIAEGAPNGPPIDGNLAAGAPNGRPVDGNLAAGAPEGPPIDGTLVAGDPDEPPGDGSVPALFRSGTRTRSRTPATVL